jgi:hypothetical protein
MSYDHLIQPSPNVPYSKSYTSPLPEEPIITPTPSPDMVYIFSPQLGAHPIPARFIDSLEEDFPPNPPNYPIHFPTKILRPTTIFNP